MGSSRGRHCLGDSGGFCLGDLHSTVTGGDLCEEASAMKIDFETSVTTIEGEPTNLEAYEGQVLLVVNTASQCGFTPQYSERKRSTPRSVTAVSPCWDSPAISSATRSPVRQATSSRFASSDMACRSRCLKRST